MLSFVLGGHLFPQGLQTVSHLSKKQTNKQTNKQTHTQTHTDTHTHTRYWQTHTQREKVRERMCLTSCIWETSSDNILRLCWCLCCSCLRSSRYTCNTWNTDILHTHYTLHTLVTHTPSNIKPHPPWWPQPFQSSPQGYPQHASRHAHNNEPLISYYKKKLSNWWQVFKEIF